MTNREIVRKYLRYFCAGDIEGLESVLATDLIFTGTFHSFASANEYLASLRSNPPENCRYDILSIMEDADSVALFYNYQKPDKAMRIAQLFKISDQKIMEILLIFDGRENA